MAKRPLDVDPFPDIPCALLNSGDVFRYATYGQAGKKLFEPFNPAGRKSASYEISFVGTAYWWQPDAATIQEQELGVATTFEIPPNSIVFIRPVVTFYIPDYLALRFNLHIQLVHRGLLLGTGPLVDPGFQGRLLIPIHNLTDSPVRINGNDGFIWVEVTKVSPLTTTNSPEYVEFPDDKRHREPWQYFKKASNNDSIRSSLPSIKEEARKAAEDVRAHLSRLQFVGVVAGAIAVLTIGLGFAQLFESTKQLVVSTQQIIQDSRAKSDEELRKMADRLGALEKKAETRTRQAAPRSVDGKQ